MPDNVTFIHSLYGAFGRGDLPWILAGLAEDVEWIVPGPASLPFAGTYTGPAQVAKFFETLATTQTDPRLRIEETYAAGDTVISVGRYSGTVTATGTEFDFRVAHVFTIREGKVTRLLDFLGTAQAGEAYSTVSAGAAA